MICEAPSYVGALSVFKAFQCEVVHAEMDADELVPAALEQAIQAVKAAGETIKFLYDPELPQPGGVTLSVERRPEILRICREHGILVLEDNPYGLLGFEAEPIQALRADGRRASSTSGRSRRRSRPACGSAGRRARDPREAGTGTGVGHAVPAVLQPDGGVGVPASTTGRARSSRCARCTASAATR